MSAQKITSKTFNVQEFNQVELNTERPDVKFVVGNSFSVKARGTKKAHISSTRVKVRNKKLTIYDKSTATIIMATILLK